MDSLFCCTQAQPYRPQRLDHDAKFNKFLTWARESDATADTSSQNLQAILESGTYAIQLVRQVNFGPLESKRYFVNLPDTPEGSQLDASFQEIVETDLIQANFSKLNSYKNFRCTVHNKFFELNVYEKNPVNARHWRANIARPAGDIDL